MLMTLDPQGIEEKSSDGRLLQAYVQQLVGQPFLHFRFSYGDELTLHFGQSRSYTSPKLQHLRKGSYILGTRASQWVLRSESPSALVLCSGNLDSSSAKPLSKEDLEQSELVHPGVKVVYAISFKEPAADGFGLSLYFSDESSILITPDSSDPAENGIADWELFTSHGRYLRVGPGPVWSYLASTRG